MELDDMAIVPGGPPAPPAAREVADPGRLAEALGRLHRGHYTTGMDSADAAWCNEYARVPECAICYLIAQSDENARRLALAPTEAPAAPGPLAVAREALDAAYVETVRQMFAVGYFSEDAPAERVIGQMLKNATRALAALAPARTEPEGT